MSPVFTSSVALAMAMLPIVAKAESAPAQSPADRNKAVVRAYLEEVARSGHAIERDRFFAPTVTFNGDPDVAKQLARLVETRRGFPDLEIVIEQQVAEGPWVATRVTFRGTHTGDFASFPATGRRVEYGGIALDRLEHGKVVEMWHTVNMHLLMRQLAENGGPREPGK